MTMIDSYEPQMNHRLMTIRNIMVMTMSNIINEPFPVMAGLWHCCFTHVLSC